MDLRTRVWNDLFQCKFHIEYITHYLASIKDRSKTYKIILITISAIGTLSWQFNELITLIALFIVFVGQLLENLKGLVVSSEKDHENIGKYRMLYINHFHELDELWTTIELEGETDIKSKYFELRKKFLDIEQMDNSIRIKDNKKDLIKKARKLTKTYMKQHYLSNNT